jgi:predicted nucleotidyltransferase
VLPSLEKWRAKNGVALMRKNPNLKATGGEIADFCRRHHILKLSFFGSVLRDDFRPDSDVDVLIEFEPGHTPGFFKLAGIERELSLILGGREIDLGMPQDLNPYFRDEVMAMAEVQYEQT